MVELCYIWEKTAGMTGNWYTGIRFALNDGRKRARDWTRRCSTEIQPGATGLSRRNEVSIVIVTEQTVGHIFAKYFYAQKGNANRFRANNIKFCANGIKFMQMASDSVQIASDLYKWHKPKCKWHHIIVQMTSNFVQMTSIWCIWHQNRTYNRSKH